MLFFLYWPEPFNRKYAQNQSKDGASKKKDVIGCICDAGAMVNKIVGGRDAFFLIVNNENMDWLLREAVIQDFASKELEISYPPEYEAGRTILVRNVDKTINDLEADAIKTSINGGFAEAGRNPVKKVIKIPNSSHLLKIVFQEVRDADKAVREGLKNLLSILSGEEYREGTVCSNHTLLPVL